MVLTPYRDSWSPDDPHGNFKAEVANYTVTDPLPTMQHLSEMTGIPTGSLIRYVLVKWAASRAEAMLEMEPVVVLQMAEHVRKAEETGTDLARLEAYESLKQMIAWLGMDSKETE